MYVLIDKKSEEQARGLALNGFGIALAVSVFGGALLLSLPYFSIVINALCGVGFALMMFKLDSFMWKIESSPILSKEAGDSKLYYLNTSIFSIMKSQLKLSSGFFLGLALSSAVLVASGLALPNFWINMGYMGSYLVFVPLVKALVRANQVRYLGEDWRTVIVTGKRKDALEEAFNEEIDNALVRTQESQIRVAEQLNRFRKVMFDRRISVLDYLGTYLQKTNNALVFKSAEEGELYCDNIVEMLKAGYVNSKQFEWSDIPHTMAPVSYDYLPDCFLDDTGVDYYRRTADEYASTLWQQFDKHKESMPFPSDIINDKKGQLQGYYAEGYNPSSSNPPMMELARNIVDYLEMRALQLELHKTDWWSYIKSCSPFYVFDRGLQDNFDNHKAWLARITAKELVLNVPEEQRLATFIAQEDKELAAATEAKVLAKA